METRSGGESNVAATESHDALPAFNLFRLYDVLDFGPMGSVAHGETRQS